jgi:hypothetical protein
MTLAQYWILALLHLFDFKHWVATPICAPFKNKEEEKSVVPTCTSPKLNDKINIGEKNTSQRQICCSLLDSRIDVIAALGEDNNDQVRWASLLVEAGLTSFLQLLRK